MGFLSVLSYAQELAAARIRPGDTAIDATAGNGVDTVFLVRAVGSKGMVHAFDIQEEALVKTRERLIKELDEAAADRVMLHLASHDRMSGLVPAEQHGRAVSAVMFNLGYLPGADQSVITLPDTTLPALSAALQMLRPGGVLTVVVYPGHPGGKAEAEAVEAWAASIPSEVGQSMCYRFINRTNNPPYLIAVEKSKDCRQCHPIAPLRTDKPLGTIGEV